MGGGTLGGASHHTIPSGFGSLLPKVISFNAVLSSCAKAGQWQVREWAGSESVGLVVLVV